ATRRTTGFMGVVRSTPPCDGNVLGHQAGVSAADRPTSGPGAPRNGRVVATAT
ncbi:Hypothetical predicted protein, partial [Marmota monax]